MAVLSDYVDRTENTQNNLGNVTGSAGASNWFTGNLDYQRTVAEREANNAFSASEAEKARQFSHDEAALSRQWSENMSNTAYQRAVADMKKAGINPAAVYSNGTVSASTPSASTASTSSAHSSGSTAFKSGKGFDVIAGLAGQMISLGVTSALQASKQESFAQFSKSNRQLASALNAFTYGK